MGAGMYVDGFVLVVPVKKMVEYKKLAKLGGRVWRDHGALDYKECVGEDLNLKWGLPFPKLAKIRKGETVVFSWITYKSRKHRDQVNARVMKDKRLTGCMDPKAMPFDMKRMSCGGFQVLVDAFAGK